MIRKVLLFGSVGVLLVLIGIIVVFLFLDSVIVASICRRLGDLSKIADREVPNSVGSGIIMWGTRASGKKGLDRIKEELFLFRNN